MKRCLLALTATVLSAFALAEPVLDGAARRFIAAQYGATNAIGRLSQDEAVRVVDEVFGKGKDPLPKSIRRKLKRLLNDGFGEVYAYGYYTWEEEHRLPPKRKYLLVDTIPEVRLPDSDESDGLLPELWKDQHYEVYGIVTASGAVEHVIETFGVEEDVPPILPPVKSFLMSTARVERVAREVVADVETVRLQSLTQLDVTACGKPEGRYSGSIGTACATYLVTLRVRATLSGDCAFKRFSFPVVFGKPIPTPLETWLFHRGMTLSVGFGQAEGGERVVRIDPVLPYPPFTKEGVRVYRGVDCPSWEKEPHFPWSLPGVTRARSLGISYDDHTFARYSFPSNLLSGVFGTFPDFSTYGRIDVWTDGSAARPDYWRDAWFGCSDREFTDDGCDSGWSRVSVRPALDVFDGSEGRDDLAALRFTLRNVRFQTVSFRPPATMKDVADFFTLATKSCCPDPGRREFAFVADASCAARTVRPQDLRDVDAFTAIREVCARNGCVLDVKGSDVTLRTELTEAQCRPPDLAVLLSEMQSLGFASVKDAKLVDCDFDSGVDAGASWCFDDPGYEEGRRVQASVEQEFLPRFKCGLGLDSAMWIKPNADEAERGQVVSMGCTWWTVEDPGLADAEIVRLPRLVGRLIFALEEGMEADVYRTLTFALQLQELGYADEAARIAELVWRRPLDAVSALDKLRETLARVRKDYPTWEAWRTRRNQDFAENRRRRDGDPKSEEDGKEEEDEEDE